MSGWLALVGGMEWTPGCEFDAELVAAAGGAGTEVVILPTAAAFERPDAVVARGAQWLTALGAVPRPLMVLGRPHAEDRKFADVVRAARFVYLSGGSLMHLRGVLKRTALWDALCQAFADGAVIAGSSAGAMVLGDPMVDPRGGAFTLGFGLVPGLAVMAHADTWSEEKVHRTLRMAPTGVVVASVAERSALLWSPDQRWTSRGTVRAFTQAGEVALGAIPSPSPSPAG